MLESEPRSQSMSDGGAVLEVCRTRDALIKVEGERENNLVW